MRFRRRTRTSVSETSTRNKGRKISRESSTTPRSNSIRNCRTRRRRSRHSAAKAPDLFPVGERAKFFAGEAKGRPVDFCSGADFFVEIDGELVPIEHRPFQPRTSSLDGNRGELAEQRRANPAAAHHRANVNILE